MSGTGTSRGDFDDGARGEPSPSEAGTSSGMVFAEVAGATAITGTPDDRDAGPIEKPDDPLQDTDDHEPDDIDERD